MERMDNYKKLVERIATTSGLGVDEIDRRVEAKRAKLSMLVSKEGAAQIVAAELGINFDQERMKISELLNGMKKANVVGKIVDLSPVREFEKNGRKGKVVNFLLADEGSNIRIVLWDTNHISLIESGKIKNGDVVEISNANMRNGELHLSGFGDIRKSTETLGEVVEKRVIHEKRFSETRVGESLKARALIVQMFDPRYYDACPECGRKVTDGVCGKHGKVGSQKRAIISLVLDDGTETLRAISSVESLHKLGLTDEEIFDLEKFQQKKPALLGEERMFSGIVRNNMLFNNPELNIRDIESVDPDLLIKEMEARSPA